MVHVTRSGRVSKARGTPAKAPQPASTSNPKPKVGARSKNVGKTARGKPRNGPVSAATVDLKIKGKAALTQPSMPTSRSVQPSVIRIPNDLWACSSASISFVQNGQLDTSANTETIALNLMDHLIKPENWNENLSRNVFSASCFFFAGVVTGLKNSVEDISNAVKADEGLVNQIIAQQAGPQAVRSEQLKEGVRKALLVGVADVIQGYGIIWEQKDGLDECMGDYAKEMKRLPTPADVEENGWGVARTEIAVLNVSASGTGDPLAHQAAKEKASKHDLDDVELDDFDTFVADNE